MSATFTAPIPSEAGIQNWQPGVGWVRTDVYTAAQTDSTFAKLAGATFTGLVTSASGFNAPVLVAVSVDNQRVLALDTRYGETELAGYDLRPLVVQQKSGKGLSLGGPMPSVVTGDVVASAKPFIATAGATIMSAKIGSLNNDTTYATFKHSAVADEYAGLIQDSSGATRIRSKNGGGDFVLIEPASVRAASITSTLFQVNKPFEADAGATVAGTTGYSGSGRIARFQTSDGFRFFDVGHHNDLDGDYAYLQADSDNGNFKGLHINPLGGAVTLGGPLNATAGATVTNGATLSSAFGKPLNLNNRSGDTVLVVDNSNPYFPYGATLAGMLTANAGATVYGGATVASGNLTVPSGGVSAVSFGDASNALALRSDGVSLGTGTSVSFSTDATWYGTPDVRLRRTAANTLTLDDGAGGASKLDVVLESDTRAILIGDTGVAKLVATNYAINENRPIGIQGSSVSLYRNSNLGAVESVKLTSDGQLLVAAPGGSLPAPESTPTSAAIFGGPIKVNGDTVFDPQSSLGTEHYWAYGTQDYSRRVGFYTQDNGYEGGIKADSVLNLKGGSGINVLSPINLTQTATFYHGLRFGGDAYLTYPSAKTIRVSDDTSGPATLDVIGTINASSQINITHPNGLVLYGAGYGRVIAIDQLLLQSGTSTVRAASPFEATAGAVVTGGALTFNLATSAPTITAGLTQHWQNESDGSYNIDWRMSDGTLYRKTLVHD